MATPHDEHFWNSLGNYDEEIISNFKDTEAARPLVERILRHVEPNSVVADLGCGPGKLLPYLTNARKVYAVDRSENMLDQARYACNQPNVQFLSADIRTLVLPEPVDVAIALNSQWPTSLTDYKNLLQGVGRNLKVGGSLVLVAMTFECMLYTPNCTWHGVSKS